jgi:hypothetical protein
MLLSQRLIFGPAALGVIVVACSSAVSSSNARDGGQALGASGASSDGSTGSGGRGASTGGVPAATGGAPAVTGGAPNGPGGVAGYGGAGGAGGATGGGPANGDASVGCSYYGTQYRGGDSFPSMDGCNTCSCTEAGVVCTDRACIPDGGTSDGPACHDVEVGRLCVRGVSGWTGESLNIGDKLKIMVMPRGCWSSSCTRSGESSCSVSVAGFFAFAAEGHFCLAGTGASVCTPDCSGGRFAECESTATLPAGQNTVTLGNLSVTFTVPSTVPFGGTCVGSEF